jgi:PrcB C-terminal
MKKSGVVRFVGAAALGAALLAGCATQGPGNLSVHEVVFYGSSLDRLAWVYGGAGSARGSLSIEGQTLELRPQIVSSFATEGSLSVGGKAVFKGSSTGSLLPLASVVQSSGSFAISATRDLSATFLMTGGKWYSLSGALAAGAQVQASAQPVSGLFGGNLTPPEAAVISRSLATQGTLVVTVMPGGSLPDAPLKVQPAPAQTLRTGLYIQPLSVVTSTSTTVTTGGAVPSAGSAPAGGAASGGTVQAADLAFREVASGSSATLGRPQVTLASDQNSLRGLWTSAYGNQSPPPPVPLITNQTAVGIFLGSRPTGGYGVSVRSVRSAGEQLTITVNVRSPGAGAITTQALTSPWTMIAVRGRFTSVTVRDQSGQLIGQ